MTMLTNDTPAAYRRTPPPRHPNGVPEFLASCIGAFLLWKLVEWIISLF